MRVHERVCSATLVVLAVLAVSAHESNAPAPSPKKAAPASASYTQVLYPEGPRGITVTVTHTVTPEPNPAPRPGTVQLVTQCFGCPPETYQVTHAAMACAPSWMGGCYLWHQAIKERFYAQSAIDLYGNFGPVKAWHSSKGHWPSYVNCYDHGGFGVSIAVEGCKWSGPNPATAFFSQHINATVYYQTCAATRVGPVCRARRIVMRDYPDGHVTVRTR